MNYLGDRAEENTFIYFRFYVLLGMLVTIYYREERNFTTTILGGITNGYGSR